MKVTIKSARVIIVPLLRSAGRTRENPVGHGLTRVEDVPAVRGQEQQRFGRGQVAAGRGRALGAPVHRARAAPGLLRHDRLPPEPGHAAHDEPGGALVHDPSGHHTARIAARGRTVARTGPLGPGQRGEHLLGEHRQKCV